jgi:hypothetical protein
MIQLLPMIDGNICHAYANLLCGLQMQKVLNKFKTLREKMYFQRVAFERDSSEFRSGIKESLEYRTEIQTELNLDAALLRQKLDEILEICGANRIKITEMDDAESNRMIVDLCDESICFLESVGTANNQTPSRLACELVLDMNFEEIGGSENQEKMLRTKNAIAADIARACAGPVEKIKVRSLRPGEGSVLADLILCQGLKEEASTVDIFNLLKSQVTDSESLLKLGEVTCKVVEVRLKRRFYRNEPRKAGHLNMLKGIPRIMIDIEQVCTCSCSHSNRGTCNVCRTDCHVCRFWRESKERLQILSHWEMIPQCMSPTKRGRQVRLWHSFVRSYLFLVCGWGQS